MKAKNIVSIVLLLFVAASVVYLIAGETRSPSEAKRASPAGTVAQPSIQPPEVRTVGAPQEAPKTPNESVTLPQEPAKPQGKVVAYYFHRTQRCRTCLAMEAYAEKALTETFPDALASGKLEWRVLNLEELDNEHFVQDYGLTASALVMVRLENDQPQKWKNLDDVWTLVGNEGAFKGYVELEARDYLEGGS